MCLLALCVVVPVDGFRANHPTVPSSSSGRNQFTGNPFRSIQVASGAAAAAAAIPSASLALDFDFVRDPVDGYYAVIAIAGIVYVAKNAGQKAIDEAKEIDRRGALANKMAEEARRRDVADRRQEVLEAEPETLRRMQAEKQQRSERKKGWKVFGDDD